MNSLQKHHLLETTNQDVVSQEDILKTWGLIKNKLIEIYGELVFRSWFRSITLNCYDSGTVFLVAPSRFIRDWIKTNYLDFVIKHWQNIDKRIMSVDIIVLENEQQTQDIKSIANKVNKIEQKNVSEKKEVFFDIITNKNSIPESTKEFPIRKNNINIYSADSIESNIRTEIEEDLKKDKQTCFDKRYTFDSFVEDESNECAYYACKELAERGKLNHQNYNPLFLYGGVGLGKTHLMHAIANYRLNIFKSKYPNDWLRRFNEKIIYMPSQKFMNDFMIALNKKCTKNFKSKFQNIDILMIDDVQFFMGKNKTQEEFFHIINDLIAERKQLIISADRLPGSLTGLDEKIRSRLGWGLVADIRPGGKDLRLGVLRRKSKFLGVEFEDKILNYLAENIEYNTRELEGALNKLILIKRLSPQKKIDIEFIKNKLSDMLKNKNSTSSLIINNIDDQENINIRMEENLNITNDIKIKSDLKKTPTISRNKNNLVNILTIQQAVSNYYRISLDELLSKNRSSNLALARQIAMYLAKKLTTFGITEIGNQFGGKNHSTIIHGVSKIENLMQNDKNIEDAINSITKNLKVS